MEMFVFAAVCGVVIGIFSGLLGIGGGTIMVPLFRIVFGLPAIGATATSLFAIIPTSISGCATHLRNKTCIPLLGVITGLAGAVTSAVGVYLASQSPSWLIMLAAAAIIVYSSYTMFKKAIKCPKPEKVNAKAVAEKAAAKVEEVKQAVLNEEPEPFVFTPKKVVTAICIGLVAGLASGYVGVGGGFIMVPMFIAILGVMMRQASGTSLIAVCILALPGVIEQGILGNIDYIAGIAIVCGSIPGAIIGANLAKKVPERKLRFIFSGFLLFAAVVLMYKELTPMFM